ncbi:Protein of unknown function [Gryllus bimaculatus]|nr:Protein of unknown function [Gryllus bimaculatus]
MPMEMGWKCGRGGVGGGGGGGGRREGEAGKELQLTRCASLRLEASAMRTEMAPNSEEDGARLSISAREPSWAVNDDAPKTLEHVTRFIAHIQTGIQ